MKMTRVNKRLPVSVLVNKLMNYDVISFDIFDTLILRNISDPKDLFALLAPRYNILDFGNLRVNIESKLRQKKLKEKETSEITIQEIYDEIFKYTSIDIELGIRNEINEEKKVCYANPYMKRVFDTLKQNGKKIIITSDMYITYDLMVELLESCGYVGYDKLFISCDFECSKRDLGLYEYINKNYLTEEEKVIHIGDNYETDFLNARKNGWDSYHYRQMRYVGKELDKIGMSFMTGSFYCSIVNNFLYNGTNDKYPYNQMPYYYGFMYGGFFILGYVNWIYETAKANNSDKIIFLSRDGYILKCVYDMLHKDIPSEYALWSRHASMKTSLKSNLKAYIWQFIQRRRRDNPAIKIKNLLKDMEFNKLVKKLHEVDLKANDNLDTEEKEERLINLILNNSDEIKKVNDNYSKTAKEYYKEIIGNAKNVCIVDIGWRGSGAISLKYLFEKEWDFDCKVKALVAGTYKMKNNRDCMFQTKKDIESYMFSEYHNTDLLVNHQKKLALKNTIVELLTTATHPSFLKTDSQNKDGYDFIFDVPEVENYEKTKLIFKGEIDFIKEYLKKTKDYPELLNISGRDAYMPLNYLMSGNRFESFKMTFKDFVYNVLIGGIKDNNQNAFETFYEICEKNWRG